MAFDRLKQRKGWMTYNLGLIQAKSFRILNAHTTHCLVPFDLTSIEWALLGLLHDSSASLPAKHLADELGVEPSFISELLKKLVAKKYIEIEADAEDARTKKICLSPAGKKLMPVVEKALHAGMRPLFKGLRIMDILA